MKVFVQVIDTKTGIFQAGMIEEPVVKEVEISNALKHFGVFDSEVDWYSKFTDAEIEKQPILMQGRIKETTKVVNVVAV